MGRFNAAGCEVTGETDWPAEQLALLIELWPEESLSARAIGKRIGRSRDGVIGKAHRLGLPAKASPHPVRAVPIPEPSPELAARIRAALASGMGQKVASKLFGVPRRQLPVIEKQFNTDMAGYASPVVDRIAYGTDPLPPMHPISWGAIQPC